MNKICWFLVLVVLGMKCTTEKKYQPQFIAPDDANIFYSGRMDFSDVKAPKFWQPGTSFRFSFEGDDAQLILKDELLWGKNRNYYQLVVDGKSLRLQMKSAIDTIDLKPFLSKEEKHTVLVVKNTEANIGYLSFLGATIHGKLFPIERKPSLKMEFIGDSITCGMGADDSEVKCNTNEWYDQHNAYESYGAITARAFNAAYHLNAVSGIGLMHSCCGMKIIMPQVYDKVDMHGNKIVWNFSNYQPDIITIALGQNDGVQDEESYVKNYLAFINTVKDKQPQAKLLLISSPMANEELRAFMDKALHRIAKAANEKYQQVFSVYIFKKSFVKGCDFHPSKEEHREIADLLIDYIKNELRWVNS